MTDLEWQADAACNDADPDLFFPAGESFPQGRDPLHPMWAAGKAICARCPVAEACRDYALVNEPYGLWGGLTPTERRDYRKAHGVTRKKRPERHHVHRNQHTAKEA